MYKHQKQQTSLMLIVDDLMLIDLQRPNTRWVLTWSATAQYMRILGLNLVRFIVNERLQRRLFKQAQNMRFFPINTRRFAPEMFSQVTSITEVEEFKVKEGLAVAGSKTMLVQSMALESNSMDEFELENSLQAICYKRGSLKLLDQTKLPLESTYLDVRNSVDGWNTIRDMVVRGAPAIAISAALSLAVEVFNMQPYNGTSEDAASFLVNKLDYLVSSRPTAVNLSDAAVKLKDIISKTAAASGDAKSVFQAYIEAAEAMLKDDVASNKAIGSYGASFIKGTLKDNKSVSILTHCNTGSLATAGYGTALGVIRALHTDGMLERAFCTETRPFNQGSRLTAFELVHDKIPATLIADSAAAALMKTGRVNAVIVGADRVAANGDTANKIGTYSLALCALHHGIPFFVAAPLTSIDLSLSSGREIVIEERSPKELLNTRGGLGEQVAASGISVWNPAFDVTPSNLITAIVTEKGVITKNGTDVFDINDFAQKATRC